VIIAKDRLFDIFQDNDEIPDYLFNSEFNDNSKNETELIYQLMNLKLHYFRAIYQYRIS